jgi:hypothetical protein
MAPSATQPHLSNLVFFHNSHFLRTFVLLAVSEVMHTRSRNERTT